MQKDRIGRLSRQAGMVFGVSTAYPLLSNPEVGFRMGIAEFLPGEVASDQPYDEAIYLLEGEIEIEGDGAKHVVKTGESLWMPKGHPIVYRALKPCRYLYVVPVAAAREA